MSVFSNRLPVPSPHLTPFVVLTKLGGRKGQGKGKRDCMERAAWQGLQLPQRKQPACANLTGGKPKRTHTGISLPPADLLLVAPRGRGNPSRSQRVTVSADAALRHPHQPRAQSGGGWKRNWWGKKQQSSPTSLVTEGSFKQCLMPPIHTKVSFWAYTTYNITQQNTEK